MRNALLLLAMIAGCTASPNAEPTGCTTWQECFPNSPEPCSSTEECPAGDTCNTFTFTCVAPECAVDADCPRGEVCEIGITWVAVCGVTCTCTDNASAVAQGFGSCDTTRQTCLIGPVPSCGGAVTCTTKAPVCPAHSVPLILDGCYTGDCQTIAVCDVPPACALITDAASCAARADCATVSDGIDCTDPSGGKCTSGDASCTCQSFVFASCANGP